MKFLLTSLFLASVAIAATAAECNGTKKCCRNVKAYSELDQETRDSFGLDPELDDANICGDASAIKNPFDLEICEAVGDTPQCCGPFVPTRALPDDLVFNCHDL